MDLCTHKSIKLFGRISYASCHYPLDNTTLNTTLANLRMYCTKTKQKKCNLPFYTCTCFIFLNFSTTREKRFELSSCGLRNKLTKRFSLNFKIILGHIHVISLNSLLSIHNKNISSVGEFMTSLQRWRNRIHLEVPVNIIYNSKHSNNMRNQKFIIGLDSFSNRVNTKFDLSWILAPRAISKGH